SFAISGNTVSGTSVERERFVTTTATQVNDADHRDLETKVNDVHMKRKKRLTTLQ
ncbi:hypothetical protein A2U01_0051149, partial [Trifolium medium]|nr:hypothetical protein [Trifolium medium]